MGISLRFPVFFLRIEHELNGNLRDFALAISLLIWYPVIVKYDLPIHTDGLGDFYIIQNRILLMGKNPNEVIGYDESF